MEALGQRVQGAGGRWRRARPGEEAPRSLQDEYVPVPAKRVPVRAVKYDTQLRKASLRAVQAMHAIMSRLVRFECNECK